MAGATGTRPGSQAFEPARQGETGPPINRGEVACSGEFFWQGTSRLGSPDAHDRHREHQDDYESTGPSEIHMFPRGPRCE